jgi:hypothetical protein
MATTVAQTRNIENLPPAQVMSQDAAESSGPAKKTADFIGGKLLELRRRNGSTRWCEP